MGSTHRHGCYYTCSIARAFYTHTTQKTRSTITHIGQRRRDQHLRHKQITLVQDNLAIPTTFIISDVNCAILGLDTITTNKLQLRVEGYGGHLARDHAEVELDYIGNHFYLKATIFDGLYDYVDYTPESPDFCHFTD
eukprot:1245023-Amphidinium_carterae.2